MFYSGIFKENDEITQGRGNDVNFIYNNPLSSH